MNPCLWCGKAPAFEVRLGHGWVPACDHHSRLNERTAAILLVPALEVKEAPHG